MAFSFHTIAFSLIYLPVSPSMASLTRHVTSSLLTSLSISSPTPQLVQAYRQLVICWAKNGQQTIGTPGANALSVEFHPQCMRNNPDGWDRTGPVAAGTS
ncbi:hypothetical protein PR202_gb09730 [Eleusine coracana subsp. coracana]|uniref:Glutamine amidotransferase domain-containing protein n=1 Tax=Eleusine coracana subsp. coracana TaxID=191504 RepID=A0AAV5EJ38_ELECO|nr:hypothetical protein PR202_gb09730 [Eleusine coracana subsp. coracana]